MFIERDLETEPELRKSEISSIYAAPTELKDLT